MEENEEIKMLKTLLKRWEIKFYKENGRKPHRDEIKTAPQEIQDAYIQYGKLKKNCIGSQKPRVSENSEDAEETISESYQCGKDGVWGTDFNKGNQETSETDTSLGSAVDETKTEASNMMTKLSLKLFEMAKKDKMTAAKSGSKFKPNESVPDGDLSDDSLMVKGKIFNNLKIKNKTLVEETSLNKQEDVDVTKKYNLKGRQKLSISISEKPSLSDEPESSGKTSKNGEQAWCNFDEVDGLSSSVFDSENTWTSETKNEEKEGKSKMRSYQRPNIPKQATGKNEEQTSNLSLNESAEFRDVRWDNETTQIVGSESKTSYNESSYSKKKTFQSRDNKENSEYQSGPKVYEFDATDAEDVPIIPKQNRKRKKADTNPKSKKRKLESEEAPDSVDGDDNDGAPLKPKVSMSNKPPPSSVGNFVKLNMKVKTYKRKGKGMSGPQYKRFQWKQKMKSRSESYGNNCFKCGKSGHWANKCPGENKESYGGEADMPPISEEGFPSLKEAAMMARGVKLDKPTEVKDKNDQKGSARAVKITENEADLEDINWNEDIDPENEIDEDLEIQSSIVRSAKEDAGVPPPHSPVLNMEEYTCKDTPDFIMKGLKKFGYEAFRTGQEHAVKRILAGLSTLVVLSTGGGKSLCYQLPAYLYAQRSKAITLVISPLVSLMEDQVTGLPPGVKGACLHTNMTTAQRDSVLQNVKEGKVHFLLVSPEAIAGGGMVLLNNRSSLPPIAFVCIDEAHCLSEWSHNFRPSYLRLTKVLREKFGVQCFLGLTATATQSTSQDVAKHLGISDIEDAIIRGSPVPKNLLLSVSRDENRDDALIGLLQGDRFSSCESIIVYCTRRQETDRLATLIRTCLKDYKAEDWEQKPKKGRAKTYAFWDAESYHAGLTAAQRKRVQNAFMSGRLRVVVATVAFGMGLDKSDVRGVIHYNMPKSMEGYVQEIGRAGRDGKTSHCHLFLDSEGQDLSELKRHSYANTVDYRTLKKFVHHVFIPCHCKKVHEMQQESPEKAIKIKERQGKDRVCHGHERAVIIDTLVTNMDVKEEGILTLLCYLELHPLRWVENLVNVYATCKVQCYGGPAQLQAISKKCPPVAVAIAKAKKGGKSFSSTNQIEFPVVDISDCMGWDSGLVKRELKSLSWNITSQGPQRTGVMVEFSDLAFHFTAPGDLSDEELDDVLEFLHERIQKQEKSEIQQLNYLSDSLRSVSHKNFWMSADALDEGKNRKLKEIINDYFESQSLLNQYKQRETEEKEQEPSPQEVSQAIVDIRQLICIHGHEHRFNGRAVARIFHGISSPCFPAQIWGRARRFWRSNMNLDFNFLVKLAVQELIKLK
ncbi:ATP-dependent DNA helicase Q4-like isoform X2 [Saccostrea echinata]|uniref:ATP-dependent DNA helicase Q4-like isoform X2 n=1 Tax=Saccostrea echinata TaxID=191078 RepID=UPI002A80486D|nr:ATP-dependent DNA helicase Q4-like isoform X2 [Saccostrea echinata]